MSPSLVILCLTIDKSDFVTNILAPEIFLSQHEMVVSVIIFIKALDGISALLSVNRPL